MAPIEVWSYTVLVSDVDTGAGAGAGAEEEICVVDSVPAHVFLSRRAAAESVADAVLGDLDLSALGGQAGEFRKRVFCAAKNAFRDLKRSSAEEDPETASAIALFYSRDAVKHVVRYLKKEKGADPEALKRFRGTLKKVPVDYVFTLQLSVREPEA